MHICFVCREYPPSLRGGGIASYIKEIAEGLVDIGNKVTVICASDDTRKQSDTFDVYGVRVIRLSGGDFVINGIEKISIIKKFRAIYRFRSYRKKVLATLKRIKDVDIIEVAEFGAEGLYLSDLKIPIVVRLHTPVLLDHYNFSIKKMDRTNWYYYFQGKKELEIIKTAEYITSCSNSLKQWAVKHTGCDGNKIKVIYNPVNVDYGKKNLLRENNNREIKEILFAGTVCDWKGCGELAAACKILFDKGLNLRLDIIGKTGAYADMLKTKYQDFPWFNLIGKMSREDLMDRYNKANLVCFPSWWENMPMVCIEAMLSGAIVLGSSSGGMSEVIKDGENGFLVEPKNPELLASKIKEILSMSDDKLVTISDNARNRIKDNFSLDVILKQTIEYYNWVIGNEML